MVAYLEKSDDNTTFHQIVDFLFLCSINYALTQIHAIVDGKAVFISESSVRSDILFDDEDGITCLTNDEIFENLALMGYEQLLTKLTFGKGKVTPLFDSMLVQNQAPEGEGSTIPPEPEPTPFTSQPTAAKPHNAAPQIVIRLSIRMGDSVKKAITTNASLVAAHDSDNIIKTQTTTMSNVDIPQRMDTGGSPRCQKTMGDIVPPTPYDSPLTGGYTPGSDEGRLKLLELMDICTALSNMVTRLENKLSSTKAVYYKAFITLTKRVKKLEIQLKQKRSKAVIYSSNEEEPSLDTEPLKDDDDVTLTETLLNIKRSTTKDKGKGIMQETELPKKIKKREMIQLSLDEELAQKLHAKELAKETARQEQEKYNLEKSFRVAKTVRSKGRRFPDEEIAIDAIPLATKPLVIVKYKIVKEGKISTYHIIRADGSTKRYTLMINLLENIDRGDLETLWKLVKDRHGNTRPEDDYERVL
nr:hypothetical protein [Tanacetum cinerariifolium]